jgi:hypothetical protein
LYEDCVRGVASGVRDSQAFVELVDEKAAAGGVGLKPLAVDDELRDGSLADVTKHLGGGGGVGVDIDLSEGDAVGIEELLGRAAVAAP